MNLIIYLPPLQVKMAESIVKSTQEKSFGSFSRFTEK